MTDGFDRANANGDPSHFDFVASGVRFSGRSRWAYVVFLRYGGSSKPIRHAWHGMDSFGMIRTVKHVFRTAYRLYDGADVYAIDTTTPRVVAHARKGELVFDRIDPNHVYDATIDFDQGSGD